jgi:hypothetical protein
MQRLALLVEVGKQAADVPTTSSISRSTSCG